MASIEKRGDSYRVTVSAGYDASGKKLRQSATFRPDRLTTKGRIKAESVIEKEVQAFAAQFERDVKAGALSVGGSMRFSELVDCYLEQYAASELEEGTADGYQATLEKRLLPALGHIRIRDLAQKQLDLQTYFNRLALPDQDGKSLAPATIKRYMAVLSSVVSWAANMRLIPSNPMEHVRAPREGYREIRPKSFTIEELKRFMEALDLPQTATYKAHKRKAKNGTVYSVQEYKESRKLPEQFRLFFTLAAFSGCRRGELIALDWPDLDFDACTISINKSVSKTAHGVIVKSTKTASGVRIINMPPSVMQQARRWKLHQMEYRLKLGSAWKGQDNVFCQLEGARMYPDTVSAKFKDVLRNYNAQCRPGEELPDIPLHGLRHTAASILINQHTDIAAVSKRLGHSRTSVTLDIYTHAIKEADKDAADKLEVIAQASGIL